MIDIEKMEQVAIAASSGYRVTERLAAHANLQNMLDPSAVLELITRLKAAEQDALRYRFLHKYLTRKDMPILTGRGARCEPCETDDVDYFVDQAMKESK